VLVAGVAAGVVGALMVSKTDVPIEDRAVGRSLALSALVGWVAVGGLCKRTIPLVGLVCVCTKQRIKAERG